MYDSHVTILFHCTKNHVRQRTTRTKKNCPKRSSKVMKWNWCPSTKFLIFITENTWVNLLPAQSPRFSLVLKTLQSGGRDNRLSPHLQPALDVLSKQQQRGICSIVHIGVLILVCWSWETSMKGQKMRPHTDLHTRMQEPSQGLVILPIYILEEGIVWKEFRGENLPLR